jgi:hypothetical protein
LIEYAAFWDAFECFSFLLECGAGVGRAAEFAVAGGASRVLSFGLNCARFSASEIAEFAARYHRNVVFEWIMMRDDFSPVNGMMISAVRSDNVVALSSLLRAGAMVNGDGSGDLPFATAARENQFDSFAFLLTVPGLIVDEMDGMGRSAFFYAAQNGNVEMMVRILERDRVNLSVCDCNGVCSVLLMVWLWPLLVGRVRLCGFCSSWEQLIRMSEMQRVIFH